MASYLSKTAQWSHFEIDDWMPEPWKVATLGNSWYIVNVKTKASKRIGRIGGPRGNLSGINYGERAKAEARSRNELVENQRNYPWLFRKGGKAGVMKELEQALFTSRIGGLPRQSHEVVDEAYKRCNLAGCTTKDLNKVLARVDERVRAGERFPGGGKRRHASKPKQRCKRCKCEHPRGKCICDPREMAMFALPAKPGHKYLPSGSYGRQDMLYPATGVGKLAADVNKLLK